MIVTYEDLTLEAFAPLGFDDPAQALRIVQGLAGHDIPDAAFEALLRVLIDALEDCADPDRAVANLGRWADAVGSRASAYALLTAHPVAAGMFVTLLAASQFFAELLIHNTEYLEVLTNPAIRDRGRTPETLWADLTRRTAIAKTPNAKRDALRRFKPPEVLRIGARDILGFAAMPETVREISDFADACVRMALDICREERAGAGTPFAVIAMGKLGGRELNYASDIDLIFVHGDEVDVRDARKLGEAVRETLAKVTDAGFVFRVDLRLRPEGRFGPVSRSLASCRAYYESWAEPWERQALLKARFVAGDETLGAAFIRMAEEFVYRTRVEESFIESIRQNKRRLEQKVARSGEANRNVKEGIGGIRDIEFAVQLMQLIVGGRHPQLRTGNTLEALERLTEQGLLQNSERDLFAASYFFLRTVEHRLQILDEMPVRCLPDTASEMNKFARRLGYSDGRTFLHAYGEHTSQVNALFRRLFYDEKNQDTDQQQPSDDISDWVLAPEDSTAQAALREALVQRRFADPDAALDMLRRAITGSDYGGIPPEARQGFAAIARRLLDACGETDDPDAALRGLDLLAYAMPSRAAIYQTITESAHLLPRLCRLAADSPPFWQTLLQHLEYFDIIADEETLDQPPSVPSVLATPQQLAAYLTRSRLQSAVRDIWGLAETPQTLAELTDIAEVALETALSMAQEELGFTGRFAVIGMGKLGGQELSYGSDLDVLCVTDTNNVIGAIKMAERIHQILQETISSFGVRFTIDARLRPEGRKGPLALDLASYRTYYANSAATWERHALVKARGVAGDSALQQEFTQLAETLVYGTPWTDTQINEVRSMKRRIEAERLKQPNDLKLAPGGLTDIEWTVQLLQLQHGTRRTRLRTPNTLTALRILRDDALITQADWEMLSETYMRLTRLRNHLFLKTGVATDAPPQMPDDLRSQMESVRTICLHRFYGDS